MFRVKITAVLSFLIIVVMVIVYILLPMAVEQEILENSSNAMHTAAAGLERSERINDFSVVAKAKEIADFPKLATSMTSEYSGNYAYERHLGVYNKGLLRWQYVYENLTKFKNDTPNIKLPLNERRPFHPELVFVTDENGVGVAALGKGKYDWYNENVARSFPNLLNASKGQAFEDVWLWRWSEGDKIAMYRVGIAPIMQGAEHLGTVVVGHLITQGKAEQDSASLGGHDIAYFHSGKVYASTLSPASEKALAGQIFGEGGNLGSSPAPDTVNVNLGSDEALALVRYNVSDSPIKSGFIVLTNLKHETVLVDKIRTAIPVFGLILLVAMLATVLIAFSSFAKPFEQIDQGIQEVLAGNKDYIFKVTGSYAFHTEMAHSLNLMSAFLQGKPMPDDDEDDDAWKDFLVSEVTQTSIMRAINKGGDGDAPKITGVPTELMSTKSSSAPSNIEEQSSGYQRRIYDEYITAKKNLGEDTSEIDYEGFTQRMEKNVAKLKVRHKAKDIRFSVVVRDGKVVLKPQPIM